jgi:nucleotide-binding universal stress UspA family protein
MIQKLLAAVDGSAHSIKAVDYAIDIALKYKAELLLIYVIAKAEIPKDYLKFAKVEKIEDSPEALLFIGIAEKVLEDAERRARAKGVKLTQKIIKQGDPADEITNCAKKENVDWIFLGSRGLGGVKGLLLGSVSTKVCNLAETTCITVK